VLEVGNERVDHLQRGQGVLSLRSLRYFLCIFFSSNYKCISLQINTVSTPELDRDSAVWTAAKETACGGKFEWCSQKLYFWLNPSLTWTQPKQSPRRNKKCVFIQLDGTLSYGGLSLAHCSQKKNIICEVVELLCSTITEFKSIKYTH
jgi:hypothetical protein